MRKKAIRFFSFILTLSLTFGLTVPAFASEKIENNNETPQYFLIKAEQTPYGTIYYIQERCDIQGRSVWDLVDILMAGASWAKMLSEPSWGNFGWAVLDTAALLPLLPSTAYFRQGGTVLLKADEVAKFAKTSAGKKAVSSAMKTFKYSDGISSTAANEIMKKFRSTEGKKVLQLFKDAADKGIVGSTAQAGIKKITPNRMIGMQYTHEIKIKSSQYGNYRIFGYKISAGEWIFDLFRTGIH